MYMHVSKISTHNQQENWYIFLGHSINLNCHNWKKSIPYEGNPCKRVETHSQTAVYGGWAEPRLPTSRHRRIAGSWVSSRRAMAAEGTLSVELLLHCELCYGRCWWLTQWVDFLFDVIRCWQVLRGSTWCYYPVRDQNLIYCKRGYFCWGKISRKCWQDHISRGGNFHDTTPISFIKAYGFYFRVENFFAKQTKEQKNAKIIPTRK